LPTTLRIALLAGILALLSNLAVVEFIHWRTHDDAVSTLKRQVVEQGAVLADVYRSGGIPALQDGVQDAVNYGDPQTAVGLFDSKGREIIGNIALSPRNPNPFQEGYRTTLLRIEGDSTPREGALVTHRLPNGDWLLSGRTVGDGLALRETLERSLLVALFLALLLGSVCGLILAQYVGKRVGEIAGVTSRISARDITQRVPITGSRDAFDRLGEQINEMLDRIGSLMEELAMLTDSLAHDLRSPVSRLRAAAYAAAETGDASERDQQLASVVRQADALMRILTTVLEIGRSEALTSRNQFAWFDAADLAAELAEMYEPVAEEAGATIAVDRGDAGGPMFGHRQLIAQAVSNLIENAIRYGASGGRIEIAVARNARYLTISVADSGPGIPETRRAEALKRFSRLDSSRSEEGAGLGLALVRAIAHLHDGDVILADNGPGLRAILQLPLRATGKPVQPADSADPPISVNA